MPTASSSTATKPALVRGEPSGISRLAPPPPGVQAEVIRSAECKGEGSGIQSSEKSKGKSKAVEAESVEEEDLTCVICFEVPTVFGLLENCSHPFCLDCIRKWRASERSNHTSAQTEMVRLGLEPPRQHVNAGAKQCPACRKDSLFVTPSQTFFKDGEAKKAVIQNYKAALSRVPCKHFDKSLNPPVPTPNSLARIPFCPFGSSCFYSHVHPDTGDVWEFDHTAEEMAKERDSRRRRREREERDRIWRDDPNSILEILNMLSSGLPGRRQAEEIDFLDGHEDEEDAEDEWISDEDEWVDEEDFEDDGGLIVDEIDAERFLHDPSYEFNYARLQTFLNRARPGFSPRLSQLNPSSAFEIPAPTSSDDSPSRHADSRSSGIAQGHVCGPQCFLGGFVPASQLTSSHGRSEHGLFSDADEDGGAGSAYAEADDDGAGLFQEGAAGVLRGHRRRDPAPSAGDSSGNSSVWNRRNPDVTLGDILENELSSARRRSVGPTSDSHREVRETPSSRTAGSSTPTQAHQTSTQSRNSIAGLSNSVPFRPYHRAHAGPGTARSRRPTYQDDESDREYDGMYDDAAPGDGVGYEAEEDEDEAIEDAESQRRGGSMWEDLD